MQLHMAGTGAVHAATSSGMPAPCLALYSGMTSAGGNASVICLWQQRTASTTNGLVLPSINVVRTGGIFRPRLGLCMVHLVSPSHTITFTLTWEPSPPAPKPAPKGKHVQIFKMRCKVGKGFYSVPVNEIASN